MELEFTHKRFDFFVSFSVFVLSQSQHLSLWQQVHVAMLGFQGPVCKIGEIERNVGVL